MANPGNIDKPIEATTETAFQRAILRKGKTILGSKTEIEWLDIELPVDKERGGRGHCIDLIGKMGNRYVMCELKFGKDSATDSPSYAAAEVKRYFEDVKKNCEYLETQSLHHPDAKPFSWKDLASCKTILMVAANAAYWAYWLGHRKENLAEIEGIQFCSIDVATDSFIWQKGDLKEYTPTIETSNWDIL